MKGAQETVLDINRTWWDQLVPLHLASPFYDLADLRAGEGRLGPIEDRELGPVTGLSVLHLQCHFGRDSLILAQNGAHVTGLDFSEPAIAAAGRLAQELGLEERTRFLQTSIDDALATLDQHGLCGTFDRIFVTWGALMWLADIRIWARTVAGALKPGGALYLAEAHPSAMVFDDEVAGPNGFPGPLVPYFETGPHMLDSSQDYANPQTVLDWTKTAHFQHGLGDILGALSEAGLTLRWFHEHDSVPWAMFGLLVDGGDGLFRWPDRAWLPLSFSLWAERTAP